jgi:trigger factor
MSSVINKKENSQIEIVFDIPAEDFKGALEKAFQKNSKRFSIPGFRPGKAPMKLVTKYYGEGVLYDDAIENIAQSSYVVAIKEHSLQPVSSPEIAEITEIGSEKGIKFSINVTVKPEVTLGDYKGIEVSKQEPVVDEEEVTKELDKIRERNSRMVPVEDRAVLNDDIANIDYEGFLDGVTFDGGKGTAYDLRIGSKSFIPGFEEQVIGREIGEEFDVNVTFPEDYHEEKLKGQPVVFKVKLNSIKIKDLPVADDEFAKDVSEFDTLKEYKDSLRAKLAETAAKSAENAFENELISKIVANATVEIPSVMIDGEVDRMVEEQSNRMKYQGIQLEQYLQYVGQDMDTFKEGMRASAEASVKSNLVIEAIGKELDIQISPEDIDEEVAKIAELYKMKEEDIRKQFADDDSYFKESIVVRKTIDFIKAEAVVSGKGASKSKAKSESKEKDETKSKDEAKPKTAKKSGSKAKDSE